MSIVKAVLIELQYYLHGYPQYSSSTRSTHFPIRSTLLSTRSTRLCTRCTRLSIRLVTRSTRLSTCSICLSSRSTRLAIRLSTRILVVLSVSLFIIDLCNLSFSVQAGFNYQLHDYFQPLYMERKFQLGLFKPQENFSSVYHDEIFAYNCNSIFTLLSFNIRD